MPIGDASIGARTSKCFDSMVNAHPPDSPLALARYARIGILSDQGRLGEALTDCLRRARFEVTRLQAHELSETPLINTYDVIFSTLPWRDLEEHAPTLAAPLKGTVLVVCTTALTSDQDGFFMEPVREGSVTKMAAVLLPSARVVGAFHQFSAEHLELAHLGVLVSDIPVVGDDREATDLVEEIIDFVPGLEAVYVGGLEVAGPIEGLAAITHEVARQRQSPVGFRLGESGLGGLRFLE